MAETAAHLVDHVFPPLPVRQWVPSLPKRLRYYLQSDTNHGVRFIPVEELDAQDAEAVRTRVRRRILRAYRRRGILDKDERKEMQSWNHRGGFSLDASVRIAGNDRNGLERLLRYRARPPFAGERLEEPDRHRLIHHLPKPAPDGPTQLILSPPELVERIAAPVPPPRQHRHRYYGMPAPNAPLRAAVTALVAEAATAQSTPPVKTSSGEQPTETPHRSPARYPWAMPLARIYEVFPPTCMRCGAAMRIVAFITEAAPVQRIPSHIGEPATPPPIAPARGPPSAEEEDRGAIFLDERRFPGDPLAQPEPDYEFDQRVTR